MDPAGIPSRASPYAPLERCAANVERQIEPFRRRFDEAQDFLEIFAELPIAPDQLGPRQYFWVVGGSALEYAERLNRVAPNDPDLASLIQDLRRRVGKPDGR